MKKQNLVLLVMKGPVCATVKPTHIIETQGIKVKVLIEIKDDDIEGVDFMILEENQSKVREDNNTTGEISSISMK